MPETKLGENYGGGDAAGKSQAVGDRADSLHLWEFNSCTKIPEKQKNKSTFPTLVIEEVEFRRF